MQDEINLDDIFAEMDMLGIAPLSEKKVNSVTPDSHLRTSYEEITRFVEQNGREPEKNKGIKERMLAVRLEEFRTNKEKSSKVLDIDRCNLLPHQETSLDDVLNGNMDDFLSASGEDDIFDVSGLPQAKQKPDYVASRKPCEDFEDFRPLLEQCQDDLWHNRRHLVRVTESNGQAGFGKGSYAVIRGVLCYVAEEDDKVIIQSHQENRRLRVIFENGMESDMLLRSLFRALYENGFLVSGLDSHALDELTAANKDNKPTGLVYILKSKSQNEAITAIPNLYKIGVSTQELDARLINAEHEPTYLMAGVIPLKVYRCYDMDARALENILHHVFTDAQVVLDVVGDDGQTHHPREWYSVPISAIDQAMEMIIDGSIVNYRYDVESRRMRKN